MNQTTKKQHYIWRNYLAPWTDNNTSMGKIVCLRDNKVFTTSLMNVAHENYFYEVKELSAKERQLIEMMTITNRKEAQQKIHKTMLKLYCAPFDYLRTKSFMNSLITGQFNYEEIKAIPAYKSWSIEHIEVFHGIIESYGAPYIEALQNNSIEFWKDEDSRDKFAFYLANQYFRTKTMRDNFLQGIERFKTIDFFSDIRPENIWIPLCLIISTDVGIAISQEYSAVLLISKNDCFIVGDQPAINTCATYDMSTSPTELEIFYPITPHTAILITKKNDYINGETIIVTDDEVRSFNSLEYKASHEYLFAKEQNHLNRFINN